jgi:hypothetical protein
MMAEDENITLDMVERALKLWGEETNDPAKLGNYIKEERNSDPVLAIKTVLANVRTRGSMDWDDEHLLSSVRLTYYPNWDTLAAGATRDEIDEWQRNDQEKWLEAELQKAIARREGTNQ